jgi:hypothetical protein
MEQEDRVHERDHDRLSISARLSVCTARSISVDRS